MVICVSSELYNTVWRCCSDDPCTFFFLHLINSSSLDDESLFYVHDSQMFIRCKLKLPCFPFSQKRNLEVLSMRSSSRPAVCSQMTEVWWSVRSCSGLLPQSDKCHCRCCFIFVYLFKTKTIKSTHADFSAVIQGKNNVFFVNVYRECGGFFLTYCNANVEKQTSWYKAHNFLWLYCIKNPYLQHLDQMSWVLWMFKCVREGFWSYFYGKWISDMRNCTLTNCVNSASSPLLCVSFLCSTLRSQWVHATQTSGFSICTMVCFGNLPV